MRGLFTVLVVWALKSVTATLPLPAHLTNIPLSHDVPLKLLPIYQKQQVIRLRRTPQLDKALLDEELDVWVVRNDTVDVRIYTPNKLQNLVSLMKNLEPKILVQDIQFMVDREAKEIRENLCCDKTKIIASAANDS
ncbi:hypothetical protein BDF19DRAFT_8847 [Syncephalis fuscata]|nr:hypothetical protein BDF19DRAFT_8847 [Syncephalis fuscata]